MREFKPIKYSRLPIIFMIIIDVFILTSFFLGLTSVEEYYILIVLIVNLVPLLIYLNSQIVSISLEEKYINIKDLKNDKNSVIVYYEDIIRVGYINKHKFSICIFTNDNEFFLPSNVENSFNLLSALEEHLNDAVEFDDNLEKIFAKNYIWLTRYRRFSVFEAFLIISIISIISIAFFNIPEKLSLIIPLVNILCLMYYGIVETRITSRKFLSKGIDIIKRMILRYDKLPNALATIVFVNLMIFVFLSFVI